MHEDRCTRTLDALPKSTKARWLLPTAHWFADEIEAGCVWINGDGRHFTRAPFGGYKASGIGSDGSLEELLSYTQTKNAAVFL